MADDKLPWRRSESIVETRSDKVTSRAPAISFKLFQNSSSRLTLVLWPAMTIERFETGDFTASPPRIRHRYYMTVWLFGQENHPAWCHRGSGYRGIGNGVHNRDSYWRSLTLP